MIQAYEKLFNVWAYRINISVRVVFPVNVLRVVVGCNGTPVLFCKLSSRDRHLHLFHRHKRGL